MKPKKPRNAEVAAAYYQANKEKLDANSRKCQIIRRKENIRLKALGLPVLGKKVYQPVDMITLKEIANRIDMLVPLARAVSKDSNFNMPKPVMLRIDGVDLYDTFEIVEWIQVYRDALATISIVGLGRRKRAVITLEPHVMLLINWLQATKHVSAYAAKLRHTAERANLLIRMGECA